MWLNVLRCALCVDNLDAWSRESEGEMELERCNMSVGESAVEARP
jgi:hypothetical protein